MSTTTTTSTNNDQTLTQRCYVLIEENIINGTFVPGQKLRIAELQKFCSVGGSPIREALSRLVSSGLVKSEENRGFLVTHLSESDIRDLYKTFNQIENLALTEAIKLGDETWQTEIVGKLYQLSLIETKQGFLKSSENYDAWAERNTAFHEALITGCKSQSLISIYKDLRRRMDRYCKISFNINKSSLELNHREHAEIAKAALQRNSALLSSLMTHHHMDALEDVIKLLKTNKIL